MVALPFTRQGRRPPVRRAASGPSGKLHLGPEEGPGCGGLGRAGPASVDGTSDSSRGLRLSRWAVSCGRSSGSFPSGDPSQGVLRYPGATPGSLLGGTRPQTEAAARTP